MKATLILENGQVFTGESIGATADVICEMVFNTSMVGYQEILTDPSNAGQGIVMSYPLIGNYGVNHEDNESGQAWVGGFVVRHLSERGSNFRCEDTLDNFLKKYHITGIQGVDTRAITKILRNEGTMNGMISCAEHFNMEEVLEQLHAYRVSNRVEEVSSREVTEFPAVDARCRLAMLDLGETRSMVEKFTRRGCSVTAYPYDTGAERILSDGFDGVLLSDGPGDPADYPAVTAEVKKLYDAGIPVLALGLGHQLMAAAVGAKTEKHPYGHRGANHPVRDVAANRVFITTQNHGYVVTSDSVDSDIASVTYVNVNDGTCEGITYHNKPVMSFQFQPTDELIDKFLHNLDCMKGAR